MTQGGWALLLSGISLGVSAALGFWQVWRYYLEGGRLVVTLEFGQLHPGFLANQSVNSRHAANPTSQGRGEDFIEVLFVAVANRGRTAATLTNVGIDLGPTGDGSRRYQLRNRHRITPTSFAFDGDDPKAPLRLEPLDSCTFIFDAEPALRGQLRRDTTTRTLRGCAMVAGFETPRLSKERLHVRNGLLHLTKDRPTVFRVVFAELDRIQRRQRDLDTDDAPFSPSLMAMKVQRAVDRGEAIEDAVDEAVPAVSGDGLGWLNYQVRDALIAHGYWQD